MRFTPAGNGELDVEVTSFDDDGAPRNFYRTVLRLVAPDLEPLQAELTQVGPGRYAGRVRAADPGAYLVRVAQTYEDEERTDAASRTLGIVSPAAAEYRRLGVDTEPLAGFATAGGGRELPLAADEPGAEVWRHDLAASAFPTPIWPWLLLLAIVLVPLDVGVRRVALARSDLEPGAVLGRATRGHRGRRARSCRRAGRAASGACPRRAACRARRRRDAGAGGRVTDHGAGIDRGSRPIRRPSSAATSSRTAPAPAATEPPAPTSAADPTLGRDPCRTARRTPARELIGARAPRCRARR